MADNIQIFNKCNRNSINKRNTYNQVGYIINNVRETLKQKKSGNEKPVTELEFTKCIC